MQPLNTSFQEQWPIVEDAQCRFPLLVSTRRRAQRNDVIVLLMDCFSGSCRQGA